MLESSNSKYSSRSLICEQAQFRKEKGQLILREQQIRKCTENFLHEAGWDSWRVLKETADVIFEAAYHFCKISVICTASKSPALGRRWVRLEMSGGSLPNRNS